jgi:hypothetical protein
MKNNLIVCNFLFLCFFLINQSAIGQSDNGNVIRLKADFSHSEKVKMSDLFSEIKYLPLETNPNCLIGYMNIPVFGKDILVNSHGGGGNIYRFSGEGKFLNKIGNKGRGPGEYVDNNDVRLIGDTVFVVSNFSNNIICYSLKGVFLKNYHLNIEAHPKSIVQLHDKSFMISLSNPSKLGNIIKTDRDFNIKIGFIKNVPLSSNPNPFRFEKSKDQSFYFYNFIDTIFEISRGYPIPSIVIDYLNFKKSREKLSIYEKDNAILTKPYIADFSTSDTYFKLTLYYPLNKGRYTILYRIADGKQFSWTELTNDIDNGTLDLWSGFLSENNLILWLMPTTILERFKNMTSSEKSDPKNSRFINMASKITPESNPVIMICKLR